jgi:hypothetical protein
VRMLNGAADHRPDPRRQAPQEYPELRDVVKPRKRSGLRSGARLHAVPDPAATPVSPRSPEGAAAVSDARRELKDALLSVRCGDCDRPASMGCDPRMPGVAPPHEVGRAPSGPIYCHESRILEAAKAQPDPYGWLGTAITTLGGES